MSVLSTTDRLNTQILVGCYALDSSVRPRLATNFSDNSRDKCIQYCSNNYFSYAGIKFK